MDSKWKLRCLTLVSTVFILLVAGGSVWSGGDDAGIDDEGLVEEKAITTPAAFPVTSTKLHPVLTFWCSPYPLGTGWAVRVTRRWNSLHPDKAVLLRALPPDRLAEDVFREAIKNGTTPDVTNHLFPPNVQEFVAAGALLPLDNFPELMEHLKERVGIEQIEDFRSPDGRLYQFPGKNNPIMFQYNVRLFRQYGITVPRSYSEFIAAGKRLRETMARDDSWFWAPSPTEKFWKRYYDFVTLYIAASGGKSLLTSDGKAAFDNPDGVAVMSFLADLYKNRLAPREDLYPDNPDKVKAFVAGRLAMLLTGPWNIEVVRDVGGEDVLFDFAPPPVPDVYGRSRPVFTYGNYRNFGIFASCKHPDIAAEFIRFATSRESDLEFLRATWQLPCRRDLYKDPEFASVLNQAPSYLSKFALQSQWVRPVDNAPHLNQVLHIISRQLVECAVERKKTPQQAVHTAAVLSNKVAEKYKDFYSRR